MPVTTKAGDRGFTNIRNQRIAKDEPLIECLGTIDEASSLIIHMQASLQLDKEPWALIVRELYEIAAYVAGFSETIDMSEPLKRLDTLIEANQHRYSDFIYPYDNPKAAMMHYVRTVIRRAERRLVSVHEEKAINDSVLRYMNRLSDYLFVNELI